MVAKKAIRQERAAERDTEQRRQEEAAKAQAYKKTVAQFKQSKKQARIDKNDYISIRFTRPSSQSTVQRTLTSPLG